MRHPLCDAYRFHRAVCQRQQDNSIPRDSLILFEKGQREDDFAQQQRKQFHKPEGVLFIGKAQEKCRVHRTEKRRNPQTKRPSPYSWIVKSSALVNYYYFYFIDEDFGPACEPCGSAPEPTAAFSAPDSDLYCQSFPHPTPRSGAASINLIRRSQLGSNTQN